MPSGRGVPWVVVLGLCSGAVGVDIAAGWWVHAWLHRTASAGGSLLPSGVVLLVALGMVLTVAAVATPTWLLVDANRRLAGAARRWAGGELSHRVDVGAGSGLAGLAESLNQMAAALQRREETNRLHQAELEEQAERLAATSQLAAGVAHELNNPLGGILLCANLWREATPADDPSRDTVGRIIVQATRARDIVRGLLDFARQSPATLECLDVNRLVTETLLLLDRHPQLQAVQVRTELSKVPLWVDADAGKLQQVLVNTIGNALDAMRPEGVLTVRTGFCERPGYCRVAVSDTGCGIPQENLARVFEPFFTTKEVGHGVGLGLAISHGIVQQHGGEIEVQSQVGVGTTVRVMLPLSSEEE